MTTTQRRASLSVMFVLVTVLSSACTVDDVLNIVKLLSLFGII